MYSVEGLYCKRPIQCLASSERLTPHPPLTALLVLPPAFGAGGGHTRWVERGWGVNSSEDARHCSVLYICKYFVMYSIPERHKSSLELTSRFGDR
jgi:hypothetical protein